MRKKQLNPPSKAEIEAEAARLRDNGDEMPYAAYNTLLWVLGYGVMPPSKLFATHITNAEKDDG